MSKEKIIGIDLGTTNSCVAIIENGTPVVLENPDGKRTTPSVVSESKGANGSLEMQIGESAKRSAVLNPSHTYSITKAFIGRSYDECTSAEKKRVTYTLSTNSRNQILIEGVDKKYDPSEIGAVILKNLKEYAEKKLGEKIKKAVITVPAYFGENQRQATKAAGEIAGLEVVRIINEPTAAAMAFGFNKPENNGTVLVYDLGGGTFDVSILKIEDGLIQVIATKGDTQLGGEDFDNALLDYMLGEFKRINNVDLRNDPQALQRIKAAAEDTKIKLSGSMATEVNLPFLAMHPSNNQPLHFQMTITRAKFNSLIDNFVERTINITRQTIEDGKLTIQGINEVLLVGGSTRVPLVKEKLSALMGKTLNESVNPDEAVAVGAAIQGAILAGDVSTKDMLLLDVTPLSLGLETLGGVFTILIPKNTTIPTKKSQVFSTAENNQPAVGIRVFQGERPLAQDNKLIGSFDLSGIAPAPKGVPQIEVTFALDPNGILTVTAVDKTSNKSCEISIQSSGNLSKEDIERMKKEAEEHEEEDKKRVALIETRNQCEAAIYNGRNTLKEFEGKISEELKNEINTNIEETEKILTSDNVEEIRAATEKLHLVLSKIYEEVNKNKDQAQENTEEKPQQESPEQ